MLTVQTVEPVPRKGSASPSTRFDLVRLEAAIEAAVCRALRQKKGATHMHSVDTQMEKPAEIEAQQASGANERPEFTPNVNSTMDVCQEAVGKVLEAVEERARADYEALLGTSRLVAREMDHLQRRMTLGQSRQAEAESEAQQRDEADHALLQETKARVRAALAPYIAAGVISAEEIETHFEGALREAGERLSALRQEARVRLDSLQAEMAALQARQAELGSRRSALEARRAQLRTLPCIAALEQAREVEKARKSETVREATRFLESAPWHELSWQKQLTQEMEKAVALASKDQTVFDALVRRLGQELEQVNPARPGLGWSVVRAIEALELPRLFSSFEVKKAELVQAARRRNRSGHEYPAMSDKVVSLAFRWGARVTGR